MRIIIRGIMFIFIIFLIKCTGANRDNVESESTDTITFDSLKKNKIDVWVEQINNAAQQSGQPITLPFQVYNPNDTIKLWLIDEKPSRISINLKFPDKHVWPTFFIKDEKLILVRYRFWSMSDPIFASETMAYLDGSEIIYCTDRRRDLEPGALPFLLREEEFGLCTRSTSSIRDEYIPYWDTVKDFLDRL